LAWLIRKQSRLPFGPVPQHCHCSPLLHLYQFTKALRKKWMVPKEEGQSKVISERQETNCITHGHPVKNKISTRFLPLGKACYSRSNHLTPLETGICNTVQQVCEACSLCSCSNPEPILLLLVEPILMRGTYPRKTGRWTLFLCLLARLQNFVGSSGYLHQVG
jgi:hypothetical protein